MLRTILRSVLRAPADDAGAGGGSGDGGGSGGDDTASELAKAKAALATYKAKEAELSKKAKDAETAAARASGELSKVLEIKEAELAAERKAKEEALSTLDNLTKAQRQAKTLESVAAKLGVAAGPVLIGLLPQTGLDVAPENLTDAHVTKIADAVKKLAPDLKPTGRAGAPPTTGGIGAQPTGAEYWAQRARRAAGRE